MAFAQFMDGPAGRIARIAAGILISVVGLFVIQGAIGAIVGVIGLVPLAAGAFDVCLFAPLFGAPLSGAQVRAALSQHGAAGPR